VRSAQPPESLLSAYVLKLILGVGWSGWLQSREGMPVGVFVDDGPRNRLKPARVASLLSSRAVPPLLF
jgi:hypothetical protein